MPNSIFEDATFLQLFLAVSSALLLLSLGRIFILGRENRAMRKNTAQMESWAGTQQRELVSIHQDAQQWRVKTQRQFDVVRAELAHRLEQSEQDARQAQTQADTAREQALAAAMTRISELEEKLKHTRTAPPPTVPTAPAPVARGIPALPAMETLRVESLQDGMAAMKAEAETLRQRNSGLQRALLLARRKHPAPRRNGSRMARHG